MTIQMPPTGGFGQGLTFDVGGFGHLQTWVRDASSVLIEALQQVETVVIDLDDAFGPVVAAAGPELVDAVVRHSGTVLERLQLADDPESDIGRTYRASLIDHGLAATSPDWRFKFAVYQAHRFRCLGIWDQFAQASRAQQSKWLKRLKALLMSINGILKSILDALGAGAALVEIKDAYETVVDVAADELLDD